MNNKFTDWLMLNMREREWSQSDLARASGLTRQAISYYLGDKSKSPDEIALRKLARAFQIPPEQVFRAAGLLPPKPADDPWVDEMAHKLGLLPQGLRNVAGRFINSLIEGEEANGNGKTKPKPKSSRA